jgi:hypothetical protein
MNQKNVYTAGIILYLISLCLPVWNCTAKALFGYEVLTVGWMGILGLEPRWFCNLVVVFSSIHVLGKEKPNPILQNMCFLLSFIAITTILGPYMCGPSGGTFDTDGKSVSFGWAFWIASLWVLSAATMVKKKI